MCVHGYACIVCMNVHVYTCTHECTCVFIRMCVSIHVYTHVHECMCVHECPCMCMDMSEYALEDRGWYQISPSVLSIFLFCSVKGGVLGHVAQASPEIRELYLPLLPACRNEGHTLPTTPASALGLSESGAHLLSHDGWSTCSRVPLSHPSIEGRQTHAATHLASRVDS